jgi:hypothetical protein
VYDHPKRREGISNEVARMEEIGTSIEVVSKTTTLAGKLLGPWITRRQANADAEATIQEALARRVSEYIDEFPSHPDVMDLLATCGGRVGIINLTRILQSAHSQLTDEARPELVGDDWFANFREKARTCSDEDFAKLWASLLAGEVNKPGSYSQKTVNILADIDVQTANMFASLCKYALTTETGILLVVPKEVIGSKVSDYTLSKLKGLGLVDFVGGHDLQLSTSISLLGYDGGLLEVKNDAESRRVMVNTGSVHLTPFGKELAGLCLPVGDQEDSVSDIVAFWESKDEGAKVVRHAPIARTSSGSFVYSDGSTGFIKHYSAEQLEAQQGTDSPLGRAADELLRAAAQRGRV